MGRTRLQRLTLRLRQRVLLGSVVGLIEPIRRLKKRVKLGGCKACCAVLMKLTSTRTNGRLLSLGMERQARMRAISWGGG
jgi:hypothetical protein